MELQLKKQLRQDHLSLSSQSSLLTKPTSLPVIHSLQREGEELMKLSVRTQQGLYKSKFCKHIANST